MRNNVQTIKLDSYLLRAIKYLKSEWLKPEVGFVSCAIVDSGNIVYGTNVIRKKGKILHAERNALNKYKKLFGKPSNNAIVIVTLSPCIKFSKNRIGEACALLLLKNNIRRIHFGHLHDKQGTIGTYKKLGFLPTSTESLLLSSISKNLLQFYLDNKVGIADNLDIWIESKRKAGYSLFGEV